MDWLETHERSQAWLARKVGVTPFYLNRCLHGHRQPSERLLRDMEAVMGLEPGDLVSRRNGGHPQEEAHDQG